MKEDLHHLDKVEISTHNFDYDVDGCSNASAATDQEVPMGPKPTHSSDYDSSEY